MKKLFFVESKQTYADQLAQYLRDEYEVVHFSEAKACLEAMKQLKKSHEDLPDVVVIDQHLSDMPGDKLLKKLQHQTEDSNILLMVPRTDSEVLFNLIHEGIVNYVIKDVNIVRTLLAVIDRQMKPLLMGA